MIIRYLCSSLSIAFDIIKNIRLNILSVFIYHNIKNYSLFLYIFLSIFLYLANILLSVLCNWLID